MPCYGFQLRQNTRSPAIILVNTNARVCHGPGALWALILLGSVQILLPQFGRAQTQPEQAPALPAPPPDNPATVERPDFSIHVPRPNAPAKGFEDLSADFQEESEKGVYHLTGHAIVELANATFKADYADYDENTSLFKARGHVYYRNYEQNEVIYCDSAEYNTETKRGTFHHVQGYGKTKVVARPGVLTNQAPFYFEGEYAEKFEDKYILYDGFITDCTMPHPWWTLHSDMFDIIPDDRAIAHKAVYHLRTIPVFYFPYFYKSLKKEPRKSGFLTPNIGNSSTRGYMIGLGYYYAISRSLDLTYLFQDFTTRGYAHHVDFRGKPTQKSDFNLIFYGVQDRGYESGGTLVKAPGYSLTGAGRIEFADGWIARGSLNYISSYAFRQQFSESFTEAIFAESHSTASVEKNFDFYNFSVGVNRTEEFLSANKGDSVLIRKLPEFDLNGRDRPIGSSVLPLWFSFDSSFGLYHRAEPSYEPGFYETSQFSSRADIEPTLTSAIRWGQFSLVPSFTMHETVYSQNVVHSTVFATALTRSAPEVNVDLTFPSIERIFNRKTLLGDKLKHVIEPRLSYKYVSGVKRFQDTLLFDPLDLLNDTSEIEIGLTNRLYARRGDTVTEVFSWELFQKRFFDPTFGGALVPGQRNVLMSTLDLTPYTFITGPRNYSPIVSILRGSPRNGVNFTWESDYDPLVHRFVNSSFSMDLRVKRYFVSAGSDQLRPDPLIAGNQNQFRTTFGYGDPNRKGWNAAFSSVYDVRIDQLLYGVAQITYNTDCCGLSFQIRRFDFGTRVENQYLISFSIANIGSVGNLKKQERLF
jgi:LPS-assembly protein